MLLIEQENVFLAKDDAGKLYYVCGEYDDDYCFKDYVEFPGKFYTWHRRLSIGSDHHYSDPYDYFLEEAQGFYYDDNTKPIYDFICSWSSNYEIVKQSGLKALGLTDRDLMYYDKEAPLFICERYQNYSGKEMYRVVGTLSTTDFDQFTEDDHDTLLYLLTGFSLPELMDLLENEQNYYFQRIYLYDHSGYSISTHDFYDRWDSGCVGVYAFTKQEAQREFGVQDDWKERCKKYIESVIQEYDNYLNGDCYYYYYAPVEGEVDKCISRQDVHARSAFSCGGFIGDFEARLNDYLDGENLTLIGELESFNDTTISTK